MGGNRLLVATSSLLFLAFSEMGFPSWVFSTPPAGLIPPFSLVYLANSFPVTGTSGGTTGSYLAPPYVPGPKDKGVPCRQRSSALARSMRVPNACQKALRNLGFV